MKYLRLLSRFFFRVLVVLAVLGLIALTPPFQSWCAQLALDHQPGFKGSVGSFWAVFGKAEIKDLSLESERGVFTAPLVEVSLPVLSALWHRQVAAKSLVAKGWTLDLRSAKDRAATAEPGPATAPAGGTGEAGETKTSVSGSPSTRSSAAVPVAEIAARGFQGFLNLWALPWDGAVDGLELEGDVLLSGPSAQEPIRVHLTAQGGGLSANHEGTLATTAEWVMLNAEKRPIAFTVQGSLVLGLKSLRVLDHFTLTSAVAVKGGTLTEPLAFTAQLSAARGPNGEERDTLDLQREHRSVANLLAQFSRERQRWTGTWKIDWADRELALVGGPRLLPARALTGEGEMDVDVGFQRLHAVGQAEAVVGELRALPPASGEVRPLILQSHFDLVHQGKSLQVDRLGLALIGFRPVATAEALQPFHIDESSGAITTANPQKEWLDGSLRELPLNWLSGLMGEFSFASGTLVGDFHVQAANGSFALRPKAAFTATGVSLEHQREIVARALDLSLTPRADYTPDGWQLQCAPLTVSQGGKRLLTLEGKRTPAGGESRPAVFTGTWSADLDTLGAAIEIPGLASIPAHSASGDLTATLGRTTKWESTLIFLGPEADHSVTLKLSANLEADRAIAFRAPIKIVQGSQVSEISASGTLTHTRTAHGIDLTLSAKSADLEHLRWFAAPLAAVGGARASGRAAASAPASNAGSGSEARRPESAKDRSPFWGDWRGHVALAFDELKVGDEHFKEVRGTVYLEPGSLRLTYGRYLLANGGLAPVEGTLAFDPAAEFPYDLKVTLAPYEVDAGPLFGAPAAGQDPYFHGRFSITSTVMGKGANLEDLIGRTQQGFHLKSSGGIVRLLKTSLSGALPPPPTSRSGDALETVSSAVGSLFGAKRMSFDSGRVHLAKNTESMLEFTYNVAEIGYKEITLNATRGVDRTLHISDLVMTGDEERITGSGQIAFVAGSPLEKQPLQAELQFSAKGRTAELLANAGLLSSQKDDQGYAAMSQTVHLAGTIEHLDTSQWHDLLAKAAVQKPEPAKGSKDIAAQKVGK